MWRNSSTLLPSELFTDVIQKDNESSKTKPSILENETLLRSSIWAQIFPNISI